MAKLRFSFDVDKTPCVHLVPCPICGQRHEYFYSLKLYSETGPGRVSMRECQVTDGKPIQGAYIRT